MIYMISCDTILYETYDSNYLYILYVDKNAQRCTDDLKTCQTAQFFQSPTAGNTRNEQGHSCIQCSSTATPI